MPSADRVRYTRCPKTFTYPQGRRSIRARRLRRHHGSCSPVTGRPVRVLTLRIFVIFGAESRSMQEHYVRPDGLPPVNGYSHAVAFTGRMIAISGQVPLDGQGELAGADPEAQVTQVFENLAAALASAGAGIE